MFNNNYLIFIVALVILNVLGCKTYKYQKALESNLNSDFYDNQFTGVLIYNPTTGDTIFNHNSKKYFTPASNTKIFTLYSALKLLPDKTPAFKYADKNDTLFIRGTGDPTFLHPYFKDSTALKMAKGYGQIKFIMDNMEDEKFGPGWAWEDYDTYFSPERSSFPMYGNVVTISNMAGIKSSPKLFESVIVPTSKSKSRDYNDNVFYYGTKRNDTIEVPMVINSDLIKGLWEELLPGRISIANYSNIDFSKTAYSVPSDSLYKRMMEVSDNFLAEQILILASSTLSDTLNSEKVRKYVLKNYLSDLEQQPRWVDGSGLSRYNLFSPKSFVQVLTKLYREIPRERLFNLFPVGGKSGTLKNYYEGDLEPYVYAKSGTVGNNYSLSGYLLTKSGETLIFSFMNNHYRKPTSEVKKHMQSVFEFLRDNY